MSIYSEFPHEKWWFSIVMLVYQRVHRLLLAKSYDCWLISIFCIKFWSLVSLIQSPVAGWSSKFRCWNRHDYPTESSLIDRLHHICRSPFHVFFPQVTIGFPMFLSVFDTFQASPSLRHHTGSSLEPLEFRTHSMAIKVNKNHRYPLVI